MFRNRQSSLAYGADVVMAVLAPLEVRIERAVKSRLFTRRTCVARIARQITDADRIEASDVVFNNDGTPDELRNEVHLLVERVYEDDLSGRCVHPAEMVVSEGPETR